ncbi:hypothetical protein ACFL09_06640, partial [Planctomycetota bacterium]
MSNDRMTNLPSAAILVLLLLPIHRTQGGAPAGIAFPAEALTTRCRLPQGSFWLIEPGPERIARTDRKPAGRVLLYRPQRAGAALTIELPVAADGYYRVVGSHVHGPWRPGRYGPYACAADGVALPGKLGGWWRGSRPPDHWPKAEAHLVDVNWGTVFLRRPSVRLTYRSTGDGMLGIGQLRLEPVPADKLSDEGKQRRVPERRAATTRPPRIAARAGRFMEDTTRYDPERRADKLLRKPEKVTRQSYLDFIYPESTYGPKSIRSGPDRGQYGVRHAFPALVHFTATGDAELAKGIKQTLRHYDRKIHQFVADRGWHSQYMFDPTLLCTFRKVFQDKGAWSDADEAWFKGFFVWLCRTVHVWGTKEHFWRGPMHRSTGEGIMKRLAIAMYPDIPEAADWRRYCELQWNDWWAFRDNAINDTGYFHGQIFPLVVGAHLLGRKEVFADPEMRAFWDRLIHMTSPDGAVVPFGPSSGWNSGAATRLMALEAAATYTGDGRYRFAAHRLFKYLASQQDVYKTHHMLDHFSQLGVAVAWFIANDDIHPVEPETASVVLHHKETLRVRDKKGASHYLPDLDPDPLKAHICCGLLCTKKVVPFKLCLRSGWRPGDLYMLVDLFPRHEPMNVGAVLGVTRWNSALTHAVNSKGLTDWVNMFRVDDLSGSAPSVLSTNPNTVDAYYMDVSVPAFHDSKHATYAAVEVKDYNGFPMT